MALAPVPPPRSAKRVSPSRASSLARQDSVPLSEGVTLSGYQLLRKLGAGSMGTVWIARQLSLDREVALKVLRPSFAGDPEFVFRFTQEALAAAQLVHHHVVQVYDCGSDKGVHFFSMELVDDESLASLIEREGRLDPEVAAGYILQAARGLQFAHQRGMVHRDIKPDNLLLNRNGIVKVADLGLVKQALVEHTRERLQAVRSREEASASRANDSSLERAMGTPAYMAPEQIEDSSAVDARADIYSLGCTLYHLLTGQPPFQADSVMAVMSMHMVEPPVPPAERARHVPAFLSDLVLRMLAKRPQGRPERIDEVIQALEAFLGIDSS
ncbi:MAG TPA: serine/threonine-protein kinase, partial [Myxococcaceae bacterium]|nr:serine/threonine-protein kinase [Myxococcaceae bacterium]